MSLVPKSAGLPAAKPVPSRPPVGGSVAFGSTAAILGLGGFLAWAALAPLSSAAIAPAIVKVESERKAVQSLEGGIVAELLVRDGDHVKTGQTLLRLDDVDAQAVFAMLDGQRLALRAQEARLQAERMVADLVAFPEEMETRRGEKAIAEILVGQERIFASSRAALDGQIEAQRRRIAQLEAQTQAIDSQIAALKDQLALVREEAKDVRALIAKNLERKPRLLALERGVATLLGELGEREATLAQAREAIAETEAHILTLRNDYVKDAALEHREVQTRLAEIEERLVAEKARLGRREIMAPTDGVVLNLRYFAAGAVIPPGGPIMEIVPENEPLTIEAHISPQDIDVVHEGLPARVVLSAFKRRTTPELEGRVTRVSADALADERTGHMYYLARVEIDEAELARLDGLTLYPGMPAETMILTGERTALDYLIQPIADSFQRAFRED